MAMDELIVSGGKKSTLCIVAALIDVSYNNGVKCSVRREKWAFTL